MNIPARKIAIAICIFALPAGVFAHEKGDTSQSMQMHQMMMKGAKESMAMKPSGDVDHDFLRMMRHHHQTGIRMAEHEVKTGKDPKTQALARKIIEAQTNEIKEIDSLLKSHGSQK